jgi:probable phosphoglycerate mutase
VTSLYLVRHADYRLEPLAGGTWPLHDRGLSERGRAQARALADRLATTREIVPHVLYASTLPRARDTAEVVAAALGLPVRHDDDLQEWDSGNDAMPIDVIDAAWRRLGVRERPFHRFLAGHETGSEFNARVRRALRRIVDAHRGRSVLLVVHGGVIEVAFNLFCDHGEESFRAAYPAAAHTSITHWRRDAETETWVLECSNDAAHLRGVG